ncbi:hypothetical protein [Streptomyces sp. NPDC054842]
MRRTARVLSATALASAALGATASAAFADRAAEAGSRAVDPGGTVSVSAFRDGTGAHVPARTVRALGPLGPRSVDPELHEDGGAEQSGADGTGDGDGRVLAPDGLESDDAALRALGPEAAGPGDTLPDALDPGDGGADGTSPDDLGPDAVPEDLGPDSVPEGVGPDGVPEGVPPEPFGPDRAPPEVAPDALQPVPGEKHAPRDGTAHDGTAPHEPRDHSGTGSRQGVRAGQGGAFTDSLPALITGGVLIAAAVGAAVYRLRRGGPARRRY